MLEELIETIAKGCDAKRHRELLVALWEQERWFDTPHQRRAAEIARDALAGAGLSDVEMVPYAADGQTRWQDWTTHMAWDCPAGQLRMGETVLADRSACPQSVVYWSAPLAETAGPVVDGDAMESIDPERVRGRFVLTAKRPRDMKQRLLGTEPAAVVSDWIGETRGADDETTKWCNAWGDGPDGWYFRTRDQRMTGFNLSPGAGALLRRRLAAEGGLELTGSCDSRLYQGSGQCTTGVVPGRDPSREVWLFGHACEQGAHDNCSGVSVYVEAARVLAGLIDSGALPRPRFGIRVITTEEGLGMLSLATEHPSLLRRAMVGMNIDGAGDSSDPQRPFVVHYGPLSLPTFGWAVAGEIARMLSERSGGAYHTRSECEPPSSDDQIADPNCGVPTLWLGTGGSCTGYHSSADVPDVCPDVSLRCNLLLAAAWACAMADLGDRATSSLLPAATRWIDEQLLAGQAGEALRLRRWVAGRMLREPQRWGVSPSVYEAAAARYCPPGAEPLDDLPTAGAVYARSTWGTCTLETLPFERAGSFSRWSRRQNTALFWTDGRRTLEAVERLTRAEAGDGPEGELERLFEACVEAGIATKSEAG